LTGSRFESVDVVALVRQVRESAFESKALANDARYGVRREARATRIDRFPVDSVRRRG
jgi:hypothetical protein